jgi:hypothetical protein
MTFDASYSNYSGATAKLLSCAATNLYTQLTLGALRGTSRW